MDEQTLRKYKEQSPVKFKQKFGDKTFAEILASHPAIMSPQLPLKVEVTSAKVIEPQFTQEGVAMEQPKKKRGRPFKKKK